MATPQKVISQFVPVPQLVQRERFTGAGSPPAGSTPLLSSVYQTQFEKVGPGNRFQDISFSGTILSFSPELVGKPSYASLAQAVQAAKLLTTGEAPAVAVVADNGAFTLHKAHRTNYSDGYVKEGSAPGAWRNNNGSSMSKELSFEGDQFLNLTPFSVINGGAGTLDRETFYHGDIRHQGAIQLIDGDSMSIFHFGDHRVQTVDQALAQLAADTSKNTVTS